MSPIYQKSLATDSNLTIFFFTAKTLAANRGIARAFGGVLHHPGATKPAGFGILRSIGSLVFSWKKKSDEISMSLSRSSTQKYAWFSKTESLVGDFNPLWKNRFRTKKNIHCRGYCWDVTSHPSNATWKKHFTKLENFERKSNAHIHHTTLGGLL